jgi:hypothetical protein
VPCKTTDDGIRAVVKDKPIDPNAVRKYLGQKFGDDLERVRAAMMELARSLSDSELASRSYALYQAFRPAIPPGKRGWGAKGELALDQIRGLADQA